MMLFRDKKVIFDGPKVMGILNVTPDSFSDGGQYSTLDNALRQTQLMIAAGATFIDVGGESTRPGAKEVSTDEELSRVIPVINKISASFDVIVSVDTSKPDVIREAVNNGASLINDVRALRMPGALEAASYAAQAYNVPSCIMHMQGTPSDMQDAPQYDDILADVMHFFEQRIDICVAAGIKYNQLMIDPGFGFGKSLDHNYRLLKHLSDLSQFDLPMLVGMSRKSMIGDLLGRSVDNRLAGNIATATLAAMAGASIIRVHDVQETMDAVTIVNKIGSIN